LRVDKLTLAALDATLRIYQRGQATQEIPVWQMISATTAALRQRAGEWQTWLTTRGIASDLQAGESAVGGGSLPGETLPTVLLTIADPQPDATAARLRDQPIPVICRIQHDHLVFDPRTVLPEQEEWLLHALHEVLHRDP
jgi:L-seryl-tRNA(Ser) seleniumtransferase